MLLKPQRLVKRARHRYSRVYNKLGSPIIVLLIALIASFSQASEFDNVPNKPFRVIWNVPDSSCQSASYKTLVSSNFEVNAKNIANGDKIANLKTPGRWPYFHGNIPMNGGIPQCSYMDAHLNDVKKSIVSQISDKSEGFGVIQQQLWRVPYLLNDNAFQIYRTTSETWFNPKKNAVTAQKEWERSASEMMVKSLMIAKSTRPNVKWGYYMYPQTWGATTTLNNDKMAAIFRASTGFYPSIYIMNPQDNYQTLQKKIQDTLAEAIRVRAVHNNQDTPIFAYTGLSGGTLRFFDTKLLDLAIRLPAEMGIEGVVFWETTTMFQPNPALACNAIEKYIKDILWPYIQKLLKPLYKCGEERCMGLGRCVKAEYAKNVPYILGKVIKKREINDGMKISNDLTKKDSVYTHEGVDDTNGGVDDTHGGVDDTHGASNDTYDAYVGTRQVGDSFDGYQCRCHTGKSGDACQDFKK